MFAVICSPQYYEEIKNAVESTGQIVLKTIDSSVDINSELVKTSRLAIKHLILDISTIKEDKKRFIHSLMQYKIMNENTQIIIIAPNCVPGDELMHMLVTQIHVYDIIVPLEDAAQNVTILPLLTDCIKCPSSYKKGIKWVMEDISKINKEIINNKLTVEKEKTVTIIKDRIVGTVVIAIVGTIHRIGTTHMSLAVANYLSKFDKVAVLEFHESNNFDEIMNSYEDIKVVGNGLGFRLNNVDYFSYKNKHSFIEILQEYQYIVLDMGLYEECDLQEFRRSDEKLIISGVKDWEIKPLENIVNKDPMVNKYKYCFNFTDDEMFSFIEKNMIDLACFKVPYSPNPFKYEQSYNELLKEFLPSQNKKNKSFFNRLKRR